MDFKKLATQYISIYDKCSIHFLLQLIIYTPDKQLILIFQIVKFDICELFHCPVLKMEIVQDWPELIIPEYHFFLSSSFFFFPTTFLLSSTLCFSSRLLFFHFLQNYPDYHPSPQFIWFCVHLAKIRDTVWPTMSYQQVFSLWPSKCTSSCSITDILKIFINSTNVSSTFLCH